MELMQVELEGGPAAGWRHIVTPHQDMIPLTDRVEGRSGVHVYFRARNKPRRFVYDGFEPYADVIRGPVSPWK